MIELQYGDMFRGLAWIDGPPQVLVRGLAADLVGPRQAIGPHGTDRKDDFLGRS